ncbi:MAG: APC family permease, partial [Chloroflexota bacterium]|nr:APC family permease [Chloroflexota bacterium]
MESNWHPKPGDQFVRRPRAKAHPLRRVLGVFGLFSAGYGNVGSSIYYALGLVAVIALGATPVVLLIAGIFYIFTSLSYAEGTAMMPEAGGSASFARNAFNDLIGSMAGWALAFSYIITIAISAYTVPAYLGYFWERFTEPAIGTGVAIGIVLFLMCLNVIGIKRSSTLNIAFVTLDVVTQILIIVLAMLFLFNAESLFHNITAYWPSTDKLIAGIAIAAIAYTGIESVSQLSEEAKRPHISVPRAYILMMIVVLILFGGISVAGFSTMTPVEMATEWARDPVAGIANGLALEIVPEEAAASFSSNPATIIALSTLLGGLLKALPVLVVILAATILTVAVNAGLMGISRLTFSLGRFQLMPPALFSVHHKFKTPYRSIILFGFISILLLIPGFFAPDTFIKLGVLYAFGSLLAFAFAHASILKLRINHPEFTRPFKLKGSIKF